MDGEILEKSAYYIALFTIVGVPPGILLWFLIHPFVNWWRKVGPVITYLAVTPVLVLIGTAIYLNRNPMLNIHFGVSIPLAVIAVLFFIAGIYIGLLRIRYLALSVMLGVPEVSKGGEPGKLVTDGIYGRVRHPRYLEIGFILAAIALFVNYLAVYLLFVAYIPVIYLVVLLEERELRERFGSAYEEYCNKVPRFMPRLR